MGFFQSIADFFTRNTRLTNSKKNELVLICKPQGNVYHINSKVIVPEGFAFVFCKRSFVMDVLKEGTNIVSAVTLPETCKKLKLFKLTHDGKPQKKFVANGYYVLIGICSGLVCGTNEKIFMYEGNRRNDWLKMEFEMSLKVEIPSTFLKLMFSEFEILRNGEANKITSWIASDVLTKYIKGMNIASSEIPSLLALRLGELTTYFKSAMAKYGIKVVDFQLKKLQTKTNNNWPLNQIFEPKSVLESSEANPVPIETPSLSSLSPFITPKSKDNEISDDGFMFESSSSKPQQTQSQSFYTSPKTASFETLKQNFATLQEPNQIALDEKTALKEQIKKSISGDGKFVDLTFGATGTSPKTSSSVCPHCGEPLQLSKVNFCPICGASLTNENKNNGLFL